MIGTNELSQGNLIDRGIVFQICMKDGKQGVYVLENEFSSVSKWYSYEDIEPIPITDEWLTKFQLPKRVVFGTKTPYNKYSIRNGFEIYCHMDESGNCLFYGERDAEYDFFIRKCDTVHDFQNIYAVLNPHEELTIKQK